jgi:DnaJ-class molecular chaperone
MTDPYATLGVSKNATLDEIKASYRKLAKKYHPDLNPGNKEVEAKFKDVAHAYDLIGTKEAKEKFDSGETDEQKQHMYEEYMQSQGKRRQGPYYHSTQDGSSRYSSAFGEGMDDDIFSSFFGRTGRTQGRDVPGQDEYYHLEVDFKEAALGGEKIITLPNGRKLQVKIPAGIQEGQKLRFKGLGGAGYGKGIPGDAYVEIAIQASSQFKREGQDIISEVAVSFFEAISGAEIEVETIDGPVLLKIPPGVSSGTKLRIKQKGAGAGEKRGNHLVTLKVVMPKDPPTALKEAIGDLESRFSYNPRGQS